MFKIPEWEEDTEKPSLDYVNHKKKKKETKKKITGISNNAAAIKNITKSKVLKNENLLLKVSNKTKTIENKNNEHTTDTLGNRVNRKKRNMTKKKKFSESENNIEKIEIKNNDTVSKKVTKKKKSFESDNDESIEIKNCDVDKPDEILLDARKKKFNDKFNNDDSEEVLFTNQETNNTTITPTNNQNVTTKKTLNGAHNISKPSQIDRKISKKKQIIKSMLSNVSQRNHIEVSGSQLRERMLSRLKAAQFRYLNEKLYTSTGTEAQSLFKTDPLAFQTYHQGYQQQVKKWPVNPLDVIVKKILEMPKTHLIADMGCGEAALAKRVPHKVRSFDLVAASEAVEACDMAHTPLPAGAADAAVYCLALMGTDLTQYLLEANRVLKLGGHLLIAEVESRFDDAEAFAREVQRLGFKLRELDKQHQVFFFFHFTKVQQPPVKKSKLPQLTLKPCLYKKR